MIAPYSPIVEIGIRPGEKLHEEMISKEDMRRTKKISNSRLVILPVVTEWDFKEPSGEEMHLESAYSSDSNDLWIKKDALSRIVTLNKD